jgi:hypothetical protein
MSLLNFGKPNSGVPVTSGLKVGSGSEPPIDRRVDPTQALKYVSIVLLGRIQLVNITPKKSERANHHHQRRRSPEHAHHVGPRGPVDITIRVFQACHK